jgi:hypothetical protein
MDHYLTVPICLPCWLVNIATPWWGQLRGMRQRGRTTESFQPQHEVQRHRCAGCGRPMRVVSRWFRRLPLRERCCCDAINREDVQQSLQRGEHRKVGTLELKLSTPDVKGQNLGEGQRDLPLVGVAPPQRKRCPGETSPSRDKRCLGGGPHADGACQSVAMSAGRRKPTLVGLKENQRINPMQSKLPRQVSHHRLRCMLTQPCIRHLARPVSAACLQG